MTTPQQAREIREGKGVKLLNTISNPAKEKLDQIKKRMQDLGPTVGNFHLWYYEVYKFRQAGRMDLYEQAINVKYEGLGLNVTE